jgi:cell wall-associated NlpC family hydrolase
VIQRRVDADRFQRFKKELQTFYEAPYVWGGASSAGTDCSGFIRTVYRRAADMDLPHSVKKLYQMGNPIRIRDLQFADLVFFSFKMGRTPDHVGLYIGGLYFMHASSSRGVTLSRLSSTPYTESYVGSRRLLD